MNSQATIPNSAWSDTLVAGQSGGERAAVQTLRECQTALVSAKHLDCGGFSTAFEGVCHLNFILLNFP